MRRHVGQAQWVTVRRRAFRTWKGLRVGHRSATIPERHPTAGFVNHSWWLETARRHSGGGFYDDYPVVEAIVDAGRVTMITGWIGAAGYSSSSVLGVPGAEPSNEATQSGGGAERSAPDPREATARWVGG